MSTSQQLYFDSLNTYSLDADEFCVSLLPLGDHLEYESKAPNNFCALKAEVANLGSTMTLNIFQQPPRSVAPKKETPFAVAHDYATAFDTWFTFTEYHDAPQRHISSPESCTSIGSIYDSPPAPLANSTSLLMAKSHHYPGYGFQFTPSTSTAFSSTASPVIFDNSGTLSVGSTTPTTDYASSPIFTLPSSYASSVHDPLEFQEAPIKHEPVDAVLEFDGSYWSSRYPQWPAYMSPSSTSISLSLGKPAGVSLGSSSYRASPSRCHAVSSCKREYDDHLENAKEIKRIRLTPPCSSEESSEDEASLPEVQTSSNENSPQMRKGNLSKDNLKWSAPHTRARKGRRKLGDIERKEVHELRKMGACTRCWGLKMKCGEGTPCPRCLKLGGSTQCVRVHFVDLDVFSRWLSDSYSRSMMHNFLRWSPNSPSRTIHVSHEQNGLSLPIFCYEFVPLQEEQVKYWYKSNHSWQSVRTTPYSMKKGINVEVLDKYIENHIEYYVNSHFKDNNPIMHETFSLARKLAETKENATIKDTLKLWTTHQLLLKGATIVGEENLSIPPINDPSSSLHGKVPMPRVMANQLDHLLERRIWQLERQLLSDLQRRILSRKREEWVRVYFCLVIFMNILERDTWRLFYWCLHDRDGYSWRQPLTHSQLIEKNIRLSDSLAAHFMAISKGLTPFSLDWSTDQTRALLTKDEKVVSYLERVGKMIREPNHLLKRRNGSSGYIENDERSFDFLYSSKVMII